MDKKVQFWYTTEKLTVVKGSQSSSFPLRILKEEDVEKQCRKGSEGIGPSNATSFPLSHTLSVKKQKETSG